MQAEERRSAHASEILHYRFTFAEVQPAPTDIERVLGYPPDRATAPVTAAIHDLLESTSELWSIEGGCAVYPTIERDGHRQSLSVEDLTFDLGKIVSAQLAEAESIAVFVCTAGSGIEEMSRRLISSGDPFTGFIADTLGSLVVENAMDQIQLRLAAAVKGRGLQITERYSPGYCGWQVAEQQQLFRLLPAGFCGVSLTDSSLMQPIKSVSGFIGLGTRVTRKPYACRFCDLTACLYRKRRATAETATPSDGD